MAPDASITLHWLPLGAGGWLVSRCGRTWEWIRSRREGREPRPIFHAALEVAVDGVTSVIEIAPALNSLPQDRGVAVTGPVGARWAGRFRIFRYELRCWPGGVIPDVEFETAAPVVLSRSREHAVLLLESAAAVPSLTWGRDECGYGEMWNSNSVIAWLIAAAGLEPAGLHPPRNGVAPGWDAGIRARRSR